MKLIIQIPCFNEAGTLHRVLSDLPTQLDGIDVIETLVVDDGSSDGTSAVALGLGVDHVVRHNRNRGLAAAFATGMDACLDLGADVIVNTDGDHQYPGSAIAALVAPIVDRRADMVVGDRRPGQDPKFSPLKRFLQRLGRRVVSGLAGRDLPDPVSGFRAYSRQAARRTHIVTNYSYTIESLMQANCKGLAIEFVPIETNAATRPSRLFRSLPMFLSRSAVTMLRVFFMFRPLAILTWFSAALAVVGLIPVLRFLGLYVAGYGDGHLQSLVLGGVLIILAAIMLVAGMIADLVAHNRRLLERALERLPETGAGHDTSVVARAQLGSITGLRGDGQRGDAVRRIDIPGDRQACDRQARGRQREVPVREVPVRELPVREVPVRELPVRELPVRDGATLIELLVVMAIVAIMVGLLMPSVQSAREAARRMQCAAHLKQLSLAVLNHESTLRYFPSGGWGKNWAGLPGVGAGPNQPGGWIYQVLPYMEQQALYDLGGREPAHEADNSRRLQTPVPILYCPSRRSASTYLNQRGWQPHLHSVPTWVARNDYAINGGGVMVSYGTGPATLAAARTHAWPSTRNSTGVCFLRSQISPGSITDGLSQTYLVGEKQIPFTRYEDGSDMGDNEGAYSGDDRDVVRYVGTSDDPRFKPCSDAFLPAMEGAVFGAAHPTGFQMSLCDGSVRMISYSIDRHVHAHLGARNDGQVIPVGVID